MIRHKVLYLGTMDGVVELAPEGEGWRAQPWGLEGKAINHLRPHAAPGALLAAVRHDGVYQRAGDGWRRVLAADAFYLALAPDRERTVYAGVEPAGVYRSDDGGLSWRDMASFKELPSAPTWYFPPPPHTAHVRTIVIHPDEPQTIYAGIEVGGVAVSRDRGETWQEASAGIYADVHTLAISRRDRRHLYACTGRGFYRSQDAGASWEYSPQGMELRYQAGEGGNAHSYAYTVSLAVVPAREEVLIAAAAVAPPGIDALLYRSLDDGQSWQPVTAGLPEKMERVPALAVTESNVYLGTSEGELFTSDDAGATWQRIAAGLPSIHSIAVAEES